MSELKLKMTTTESGPPARVTGFPYEEELLLKDLQNALDRVQWRRHIRSDMKVFVKPILTLPFPKPGVATSACIIEAVLNILKSRASTVYVGESDGGYGSFPAELVMGIARCVRQLRQSVRIDARHKPLSFPNLRSELNALHSICHLHSTSITMSLANSFE